MSESHTFNGYDKGKYRYLNGFGNHFQSEARAGVLPVGQNSPQVCVDGLYPEQLSGSPFTVARHSLLRTWFYRERPSVAHGKFHPLASKAPIDQSNFEVRPEQLRWKPFPLVEQATASDPTAASDVDWVHGLHAVCGAGSPQMKSGSLIYTYSCNRNREGCAFYSSDGDYLIVPQQGTLDIQTEMGFMEVNSGEICVIPRGILFSVSVPNGSSRGYAIEVFEGHFEIPSLGPIGANGLANPRDFQTPVAAYDVDGDGKPFRIINKFINHFFEYPKDHSPFNVVAWHGNYVPYKYNLAYFCTVNAVAFDHADPSIFTVLTCQSVSPGTAVCDFVIFPWRWTVQEHTFRPPYYHKNCMSEFMGLIRGVYEAKAEGFLPGGASLHSCMTSHGPDRQTFVHHSTNELVPYKIPDTTLAFMFESTHLYTISPWALQKDFVDANYTDCWNGLAKGLVRPQ